MPALAPPAGAASEPGAGEQFRGASHIAKTTHGTYEATYAWPPDCSAEDNSVEVR